MIKHTVIYYYKSIDAIYICNGSIYIHIFLFDDDYDIYTEVTDSNYEEAINKLRKQLNPNTINLTASKIYYNLAVLYELVDDIDNSLSCAETSASLGNIYALLYLGHYYMINKEYKKALAYLEESILEGSMFAIGAKGDYYKAIGDYKTMIELYQSGIELGNIFSMIDMGHYYLDLEDYDNALKYFSMVYDIQEDLGANLLGQLYYNEKFSKYNREKGYNYLQIASNCNNSDAKMFLGMQYEIVDNNIKKAIEMYEDACYYGSWDAPYKLFQIYMDQNNEELMVEYANLSIQRGIYETALSISKYYIKNGDYSKAKSFFTPIVLKNKPEYYSFLANICYNLGELQEAINNYKNLIEFYKNNYDIGGVANNISFISSEIGNVEDTVKYTLIAMEHGRLEMCNALINLNEVKLLKGFMLYANYLDKHVCKCEYRGICKFACPATTKILKDAYVKVNSTISNPKFAFHTEYINILLVIKRYLNPENLKKLNQHLSKQAIDTLAEPIECICCMEETCKIITLYCGHQVCNICYLILKTCPYCDYKI